MQRISDLSFYEYTTELIGPTFMDTTFEDHPFLSTDDRFFD
ncbi:MAG: hypothetical protein WCR96_05515 [Candidatus Methanomethylophilaceae archaeon]